MRPNDPLAALWSEAYGGTVAPLYSLSHVEYQAYSFFNLGQCCCGNTVNVFVEH